MAENLVYYLARCPADAIMFGHAHAVFPVKTRQHQRRGYRQRDAERCTGGDAGNVGDHLGVVDLVLNNDSGKWQVTQ